MQRCAENINKAINDLLERYNLKEDDPSWIIRDSPLGGLGIFARRDINVGEDILNDIPIIIGTRTTSHIKLFCVVCFKDQSNMCYNKCGLSVCRSCTNSSEHQKECEFIRSKTNGGFSKVSSILFKNFTPIRGLFLSEEDKQVLFLLKAHNGNQHELEIDLLKEKVGLRLQTLEEKYLRHVCKVLDANAFELLSGTEENNVTLRGLYPLASLANHSCLPNTMHVFNENHIMIKRATVSIKKDEEITHSYTRLIWSTPTRQYNLYTTKHFRCSCKRCRDPTEFGTYMSAFLCKACSGYLVPLNPLDFKSNWSCQICKMNLSSKEIAALYSMMGAVLSSFNQNDVELMESFLKTRLNKLVSNNNQSSVEIKYKLIWLIGYQEKFSWNNISNELLDFKLAICNELIHLLKQLNLGECKMKGLLLCELYKCYQEKFKRNSEDKLITNNELNELSEVMKNTLIQAAQIMRNDTAAPGVIVKLIQNNQT